MLNVSYDKKSYLRLKEKLAVLQLDPKAKKRILRAIGKSTRDENKKRIRAQQDPEGKRWKAREKGNKKMMKGFTKKLKYQVKNTKFVEVGFPTKRGYVAYEHQHGLAQEFDVQGRFREGKKKKEPKKTDPATKQQARELRDAGYRMQPQGRQKRGKKPTLKWIIENLTVAQCYEEITKLQNKSPVKKWQVDRPKRELLGVSPRRVAIIIKKELKRQSTK